MYTINNIFSKQIKKITASLFIFLNHGYFFFFGETKPWILVRIMTMRSL